METVHKLLSALGADLSKYQGDDIRSRTPITGETLASLRADTPQAVSEKIARADAAFRQWRKVPAPRRGELVRLFGEELRAHKDALGRLVTMEAGKILQEGLGEVQEMIDICDFAVGLSRQLYGLTIASERPGHRMMETWHPLGTVGVISAFNFPVAVWSWNAALAFVCGNSVVWKPSEKTPLTAIAVQALFDRAMSRFGSDAPEGLSELSVGGHECGQALVDDPRVPLISATGSTRMGRAVAQACAQRLARSILELGGNNAMIVAPSADLELATRAIVFSAVGTAGQRCTTLRRLFVHESVYDTLVPRLQKVYASLPIGNPLEQGTLVGPLIDGASFDAMQNALAKARSDGGNVTGGERVHPGGCENGFYVRPALAEMPAQTAIMHHETFAPILYVVRYQSLEQAIAWNNEVPQGLSSSVFTNDIREAELFMSASGSDCGIANVNIGPSGAEIGGAFGGEKETGGGRESGSDAWKAYMRRATNTVNYSRALPLAQGISFDL
ncbi:aldehyde dehydrogenase family protein [Noviherbaspirillum sp.]|uniref:L-piperidine-6-carboxylate dehydrogenase n=1 Tax=Noviherbaspirillum sp. TaxID=1926288 RepID=UPI002D25AEAE|nr:aldehyde dehydrogenase family protein [Noviherbaspirillum sp.]HZW23150.1 aldehyde dehydrogenase family protein [Noviherbaspirillum sp.]